MDEKIKSTEEIKIIIEEIRRNKGTKIVTTNGAFDMLHVGHVYSLEKAKSFGDILIVCLNSDSSIKNYKSKDRPIIPEKDRAKMLSSLEVVDYVVIFNELDPRVLLNIIKPDYHIKSNLGFKGIERETVEKNNGKIILIEDIPNYSTTNIIQKIKETNDR